MLTRTAARFEAFAKGSSASLPVDTPVDLYLGGRKVTTLQSPATEQRASWQICPPGGEYAAATCPFSAVDVLRDADDLSVTPTPHGPPCVAGSEPATLAAYQQISITVGATCVDWAAVTLYLNDVSQLVAVDLTMAEP